jgi:2'-5' RNA ligase
MYFIAIVLPDDLNERIIKLKNIMLERFGCKVALRSPAHITIIPPFWMDTSLEELLKKDIFSICLEQKQFPISVNNFSAFKPRTIFIDVLMNESLKSVKTKAENYLSATGKYKIKKEDRPFHPHITIATRDLQKKCFHEAWPLFEEKQFMAEWIADGLSILKHNNKKWDVVYTSHFLL